MKKILVCCTIEKHLEKIFSKFETEFDLLYHDFEEKDEIMSLIGDVHGLIPDIRQVVGRELIDTAHNLEIIATPSTGTDHIDMNYASLKGITVQSLKCDYGLLKTITATAEHAFLLMLASLRNLPASFNSVKNGKWERNPFIGHELQGMKVGIVGYGRLGEIFARLAHGFDMDVYVCDPFKTLNAPGITQMDFAELASVVDAISIHVHLTKHTKNMLGEKEFALMKDGMCIVNTSRGGLIDESAFVKALSSGKVGCAGIDVLATELEGMTSENQLVKYARTHDNLIITPHIGGCTYESQQKAFKYMLEKLVLFFNKEATAKV